MDTQLDFSAALSLIKGGGKLTRKGWNGKGMYVFMVAGSQFVVNRKPLVDMFPEGTEITYRPHIDLKAVDGTIGVWTPSTSDILADDWEVVD